MTLPHISASTLLPVHDHGVAEPDGGEWRHDPRCMGECYHCGGLHTPYPDTPALRCLYCERGECGGCNLYWVEQARERGLCV